MNTSLKELEKRESAEQRMRNEIKLLERELKDWFIKRRLNMELNYSLKQLFDNYNFLGLSINNNVNIKDKMLWYDIVNGKPEIDDDNLSLDAKEYKIDSYINIWNKSTTLDNPCRLVGSVYFRCLKDNFKLNKIDREYKCLHSFMNFNNCRKALKLQQANNMKDSLIKQNLEDKNANAIFERRSLLLDMLSGKKQKNNE